MENIVNCVPCDGMFVVIFFETMYNKTILLNLVLWYPE